MEKYPFACEFTPKEKVERQHFSHGMKSHPNAAAKPGGKTHVENMPKPKAKKTNSYDRIKK